MGGGEGQGEAAECRVWSSSLAGANCGMERSDACSTGEEVAAWPSSRLNADIPKKSRLWAGNWELMKRFIWEKYSQGYLGLDTVTGSVAGTRQLVGDV